MTYPIPHWINAKLSPAKYTAEQRALNMQTEQRLGIVFVLAGLGKRQKKFTFFFWWPGHFKKVIFS